MQEVEELWEGIRMLPLSPSLCYSAEQEGWL